MHPSGIHHWLDSQLEQIDLSSYSNRMDTVNNSPAYNPWKPKETFALLFSVLISTLAINNSIVEPNKYDSIRDRFDESPLRLCPAQSYLRDRS